MSSASSSEILKRLRKPSDIFRIEFYGIRYLAAITAALALEVHLDPDA
jgi:hypothetical protein